MRIYAKRVDSSGTVRGWAMFYHNNTICTARRGVSGGGAGGVGIANANKPSQRTAESLNNGAVKSLGLGPRVSCGDFWAIYLDGWLLVVLPARRRKATRKNGHVLFRVHGRSYGTAA